MTDRDQNVVFRRKRPISQIRPFSSANSRFSEDAMGGWKKEGGWKTSRMTPLPKRGLGPPLVWYVFPPPSGVSALFSCTKSTTEQTRSCFGGIRKFSGERVLWYVFLPPYVLHPTISRPKDFGGRRIPQNAADGRGNRTANCRLELSPEVRRLRGGSNFVRVVLLPMRELRGTHSLS